MLSEMQERLWVECEGEDCEEYNRPELQGGNWILCQRLKLIRIMGKN